MVVRPDTASPVSSVRVAIACMTLLSSLAGDEALCLVQMDARLTSFVRDVREEPAPFGIEVNRNSVETRGNGDRKMSGCRWTLRMCR